MNRNLFKYSSRALAALILGLVLLIAPNQVWAYQEAQAGVVVTVTYTDPINVRGGPSTVYYPIVGQAFPGDILPAIGVSPGREWIKIVYPSAPGGVGWVYATYVSAPSGELPIAESPPTATPLATATLNPTFVAAFIFQSTATRISTFTPPAPLEIPKYVDEVETRPSGIPFGMLIGSLALIGVAGFIVSFVFSKR